MIGCNSTPRPTACVRDSRHASQYIVHRGDLEFIRVCFVHNMIRLVA